MKNEKMIYLISILDVWINAVCGSIMVREEKKKNKQKHRF